MPVRGRLLLLSFVFTFHTIIMMCSGQTITYTYDDLNRLIKVDYGGGSYTEYAYDEVGNRTARVSYSGTGPLPVGPIKEGFETGDFSSLDWKFGGDANWRIDLEAYSGTYSAQAGLIGDSESSTIQITLDCPEGDISFYYKVSSESGYDRLRFYIDDVKQDEWSGEQGWTQVSFPVAAGMRTFKWVYAKDSSVSGGSDTAWIDEIEFPVLGEIRLSNNQVSNNSALSAMQRLQKIDLRVKPLNEHAYSGYLPQLLANNLGTKLPVIPVNSSGSYTEEDQYLVYTAEQMNAIGSNPNNWGRCFKLIADIDLSSYTDEASYDDVGDWTIIASYSDVGPLSSTPVVEGFETGDFSKLDWGFGGNANWRIASEAYSGTYSAQAGLIGDGESSAIQITLDCADGEISFYYKVSSESRYDYLRFYIDGVKQGEWSGEQDWTQMSFPVAAGTRIFKWVYTKDYSNSMGSDTAWIDDIVFPVRGEPAPEPFPGGGSGTKEDPYLVFTAEQMNAIGSSPNNWDKHFRLMADIDLSGYTDQAFNMIGYYVDANGNQPFTGTFDGNGHSIVNFNYRTTDSNNIGLFGCIDQGEIRDLVLVTPDIDGGTGSRIGSLVGRLRNGMITRCYVDGGSISGDYRVGGLVGQNSDGVISDCNATTTVMGANECIGGLVGINFHEIIGSHAAAAVSGPNGVGGLVGWNVGTISNCCATSSVSGHQYVGGLVGANDETVSNCYSASNVAGNSLVGGLVGKDYYGKISNCYAMGSVSGPNEAGGLVGYIYRGTISNCYSTGLITGDLSVGGLVGRNDEGVVLGSFWDTDTSTQPTSAGGTGKTTIEMRMANTFFRWGWCEPIWTIVEGQDYPRLIWENIPGDIIEYPMLWQGNGTETDPYLINTAEELNMIGLVSCQWDKHFRLIADIDLSTFAGNNFNLIGGTTSMPFTGAFDGNGHVISGLTYQETREDCFVGLFRCVGSVGMLKDIGLSDPNMISVKGICVGTLVGHNRGTINNCYIGGGNVSGDSRVGGLVGQNSSGGIISECSANTKTVVGTDECIGGLVGINFHEIIGSCTTVEVSGPNRVGGLVGENQGTVIKSYATSGTTGENDVGGLVGINFENVTNCFAAGSVAIGERYIGGLIGYNSDDSRDDVLASFWDIEASGQITSAEGIGRTTQQMHTAGTFTRAGWDFTTPIWTIEEGVSYPRLWWEP